MTDHQHSHDQRQTRRAFLTSIATTTAALGVAPTLTAAQSAAYETITVPAGDTHPVNVASGETVENLLIDATADGASVQIHASGDGWTIRNVGVKGQHPGGHYQFTPGVPAGGSATVENLYLGDPQASGTTGGGIWVNGNLPHQGTLILRNIHVGGKVDNGMYGADSASGVAGVVNAEASYFVNNNIANLRLGATDGRTCRVDNCAVAIDESAVPACGAGCSNPGAVTPRGIWAWYGRVAVTNSDIGGPKPREAAHGGTINATGSRWGANARPTPPAGVPLSAHDAASG